MKKLILGIIVCLMVVVLIPAIALGLLPGLSEIFGSGQKDLGIKISVQDSVEARAKLGTEIIAISSGDGKKDFTLEGRKEVNLTMDSKELTAHSNHRPWKNYPVKNLQIRIHEDGTIESSAILIVSKAMPYAMGLGYSEAEIRQAMQKYNIPPIEVPIYIKGKGSVINDKVEVNAQTVKIGMIGIPQNIVSQANGEAEEVLNDLIQKHSHSFHADSLTFDGGLMKFAGTVAEREYVVTE